MKRRAKGEGSLLKLPNCRYWYAQYYQDGKPKRVSTRTEIKAKALVILRGLMGDSERGLTSATDLKKITYGELRAGLLADYETQNRKSLKKRADGSVTIAGLQQLDEFMGYRKDDPEGRPDSPGPSVMALTTDKAREFVKARKAEKPSVGNAVINRSLACLRRMLTLAREENKIQTVPVIKLLQEPDARSGFVKADEFEAMVKLLPTHLQPLIYFLYGTATRLGEALAIDWNQVDFDAGVVRLKGSKTKTGKARDVPLPSVVRMFLGKMEPKVGKVFDATNLRREWMKACTTAGVGKMIPVEGKPYDPRYEGLTIHDLRRSGIRNLRESGNPESLIMKISGHRTRSVFDRYAIASEDDLRNAMNRSETFQENGQIISERLVKKSAWNARRPALALSSRG